MGSCIHNLMGHELTRLLLVVCLAFAWVSTAGVAAHAQGFSLLAAGSYSGPKSSEVTYDAGYGLAVGLSGDLTIKKAGEVELGALYQIRAFSSGSGNRAIIFNSQLVQLPLIYRVAIAKNKFYFGIGGYYALMLGNLKYTSNGQSAQAQYAKKADYGLLGDLKFNVIARTQAKFFLGLRYGYGLANVASSGSVHYSDLYIYLGVQFGLTGR